MNWTTISAVITIFIILQMDLIYAQGQTFKTLTNNEYYIDSEQKHSWIESLIACMEMNMTLVTIDSSSKSDEINTIVRNNFENVSLWTGGIMNRLSNRRFIWIAMEKQFSYTNWYTNSTNFTRNSEYCVYVGEGRDLKWSTLECTHHLGFICEKNRQQQRSLQMQTELDNEKKKQQELQEQLYQNYVNQKVRDKAVLVQQNPQVWENDMQKERDSLNQELGKIIQIVERDMERYQQLQKYLQQDHDQQQRILREYHQKLEKLERNLETALEKQRELQYALHEQQNLQRLLQEEWHEFNHKKQQAPSAEVSRKYHDIILHFHQNQ